MFVHPRSAIGPSADTQFNLALIEVLLNHDAEQRGWLGEVDGILTTLERLRAKRKHAQGLGARGAVGLGMPDKPARARRTEQPGRDRQFGMA